MLTISKRRLAVAAALASLVAPAGAAATTTSATAAPASSAPYCGIFWGSLPKATSPSLLWTGNLGGVRSGRHTCFDRVVFDIAGARASSATTSATSTR